MKLAISAKGDDFDTEVERQLGKASFFLLVDTETLKFESVPVKSNKVEEENEGQIAKLICNKKVNAVITGLCDDDAFQVFCKSNIMVSETADGNVRETVKTFIKNQLNTSYSNNISDTPFWVSEKVNASEHYIRKNSNGIGKKQIRHDYIY